jgi:uncharacterized damage-inducible protein DinB
VNSEDCRILLLRDLDGLKRQLRAYPDEASIWATPPGISNSAGNIALHVAGNLQSFIGAELGGTEYERDRDSEFTRTAVPLVELELELDGAYEAVDQTLRTLPEGTLAEPFPVAFGKVQPSTQRFLAHLCGHLSYHLGQIDYHRRLTTDTGAAKGIQSISALAG